MVNANDLSYASQMSGSMPRTTHYPPGLFSAFCSLFYVTRCFAQLSQRDRAAGYVIVFAKSRRLQLTIFYGHYRSSFHHCDVIGLKNLNSVKKSKIITAFKVIEVGTNRKPVCDITD